MMWILLLAACPTAEESCDEADKACDTGDTAPDDTDPDTETDIRPDEPADTGIAEMFFVGSFETEAGAYMGASFGYGYYGVAVEDWVCRVEGTLPYEGPAPDGCPDCEWAFDLGPLTGTTATGPECLDLGVTPERLDGMFDYAWGFAESYLYEYGDMTFDLGQTVLLHDGSSWFAMAFNYDGRVWTYGDAESLEVVRPWVGNDGSYAYYYYYR